MRTGIGLAGILALSLIGSTAFAASERDWDDCKGDDPDRGIAGCTRVIQDRRESASTRASAYFNRGISWGMKNDLDRAIADYTEALRIDPKKANAYYQRGKAYRKKDEHDRAIADFSAALKLNSNDAATYYQRGFTYFSKSDYDRAISDFTISIKLDPNDSAAYYERARAYYAKADYDRAISDYTVSIKLDPKDATTYFRRGLAYQEKGEIDLSIADYDDSIRLDPTDSATYFNRAIQYANKGDHDRAITDYTDSIRLDPADAAAFLNRGAEYLAKNDNDPAITDFTEAVRLDPKKANAYYNRGMAYRNKDDHDRAIADFTESARLDPTDATTYWYRGDAYFEKNDYQRSLADFTEALRIDPKYDSATNSRGNVYAALKDYGRAIADYTEAIRLNPKDPNFYFNRGLAHVENNALDLAIADYDEAIKLDPAAADVYTKRAAALRAKGDNQRADADEEKVKALAAATPAAPVLPPSNFNRKVALVVGNSDYQFAGRLINPINDAGDLAQLLRKLGFDVVEGKNLTRSGMDDAIRQFGRKLEGADLALFFYAGHGMQVNGKNYLVPVDAKLERPGDLNLDAIDVSLVLAQMDHDNRVNLVFLDACRDNPLARSLSRSFGTRSAGVRSGLASIQSPIGTMIAYATEPDAVAFDGEGRNSPFTTALLKHLPTPGLDIGTVLRRVRTDVITVTKRKQVPWDHSSLTGDVVLAR